MHLIYRAFCCHKRKKGNYAYTTSAGNAQVDGTVTKKGIYLMETTTIGFIGLGSDRRLYSIRRISSEYQILAYNRTRDTLGDAVFDGIVESMPVMNRIKLPLS